MHRIKMDIRLIVSLSGPLYWHKLHGGTCRSLGWWSKLDIKGSIAKLRRRFSFWKENTNLKYIQFIGKPLKFSGKMVFTYLNSETTTFWTIFREHSRLEYEYICLRVMARCLHWLPKISCTFWKKLICKLNKINFVKKKKDCIWINQRNVFFLLIGSVS